MNSSSDARRSADDDHVFRLRPADLFAALALVTVVPLPRPDPRSVAGGRASLFFPVIGLCMGLALLGVDWLATGRLPPWMTAVTLVCVWEGCSAGGTLWAWRQPWNWHEEEPICRSAGLLTMAALALTKIIGLAQQGGGRRAAVLFAPMLARWVMVVLATGARDASAPERKFNPAITFREFALTSVLSFAVVLTLGEAFGVLLIVSVAALTLGVRLLSHLWAAGVSWRFLQASAQGIEVMVVMFCALLADGH